jgi:hypothetical protein
MPRNGGVRLRIIKTGSGRSLFSRRPGKMGRDKKGVGKMTVPKIMMPENNKI